MRFEAPQYDKRVRINGRGFLGSAIASKLPDIFNGKFKNKTMSVDLLGQNVKYDKYPDVIIHTSWQTNVDACTTNENEAKFICFNGLREAIKMMNEYGSKLIFISSSYIFDGKNTPDEGYASDLPEDGMFLGSYDPQSTYGKYKLLAENEVLFSNPTMTIGSDGRVNNFNRRAYVIRTDALYGEFKRYRYDYGASDQISNPTYIPYLADVVAKLAVDLLDGSGGLSPYIRDRCIFNVVGPEKMSRYEFIKNFSNPNVKPKKMEEFNLPARRPPNSSLKNDDKLLEILGVYNPTLEDVKNELSDRLF